MSSVEYHRIVLYSVYIRNIRVPKSYTIPISHGIIFQSPCYCYWVRKVSLPIMFGLQQNRGA